MSPRVPADIDEYIAAAAPAARPILKECRRVVRPAAPEAEELISYRMPAFKQHGILIYFAAFTSYRVIPRHTVPVIPCQAQTARLAATC